MSRIELATAFVQHMSSINIHVLKTSTRFIFLSAVIVCDSWSVFDLYNPTTRTQNEDRCCRAVREIL